jgi:hypothetical protein
MANEGIGFMLYILGVAPLMVRILLVEKYYVGFWDAFWNVYTTMVALVGDALIAEDPKVGMNLAFLAIILIVLMYFVLFMEGHVNELSISVMRYIGSSLVSFTIATMGLTMALGISFFPGLLLSIFLSIFIFYISVEKFGSNPFY